MAAINKVATPVLVSPHTRDRITALAIVRRERLAEVTRAALEGGGLAALEKTHATDLAALDVKVNDAIGQRSDVLRVWFDNGVPA